MKVLPIPLLEDNYSYLVYKNPLQALIVDPSDAFPLIELLNKMPEIQVCNILLTHKHWDHTGGVPELTKFLQEQIIKKKIDQKIQIIIGAEENFQQATILIKEKEIMKIADELKLTIFPSPCHTKGHLLYLLEDINEKNESKEENQEYNKALFTGDTLFLGGCGRFFEGEAIDMLKNFDIISSLDQNCNVFCGHEYTVSNLEWAIGIEWENELLKKRLDWAIERRKNGLFTIPGLIKDELETNVFMRCRNENLMKKLNVKEPVEAMFKLRKIKDLKLSLKDGANL